MDKMASSNIGIAGGGGISHENHQTNINPLLVKRVVQNSKILADDCHISSPLPKPNQVGTVMLYGIPIVSLFIESQERLCLAQISNTLLKQFSYNEIHNRRVALGITCVQCTPVQLEILRRAGAMPVSSRRCGMITRREAERLCKSFLGDNAPPRLPDDFAFQVHHECAWGCRGSFLPSRYNSSRAKCIKCSYCGLFFSPNKFIFHSHRIGPGDKYVQPDAANFNSWRRHMKLSGSPLEEITHAWEDVKAMFNGGTRKRLMTQSPSSSTRLTSPHKSPIKRLKENNSRQSPSILTATNSASSPSSSSSSSSISPITNNSNSSNSISANSIHFPIKPLNIIHHPSGMRLPNSLNTNTDLPQLAQFQRSFMMDYMWHHHHNNNSGSSVNSSSNNNNPPGGVGGSHKNGQTNNCLMSSTQNSTFQFPPYAIPWLAGAAVTSSTQSSLKSPQSSIQERTQTIDTRSSNSSLQHFYKNSAFKPVFNTILINNNNMSNNNSVKNSNIFNDDQRSIRSSSRSSQHSVTLKESISSDDEMVDIETTEDDVLNKISSDSVNSNTCNNINKNNNHNYSYILEHDHDDIIDLESTKIKKQKVIIINSNSSDTNDERAPLVQTIQTDLKTDENEWEPEKLKKEDLELQDSPPKSPSLVRKIPESPIPISTSIIKNNHDRFLSLPLISNSPLILGGLHQKSNQHHPHSILFHNLSNNISNNCNSSGSNTNECERTNEFLPTISSSLSAHQFNLMSNNNNNTLNQSNNSSNKNNHNSNINSTNDLWSVAKFSLDKNCDDRLFYNNRNFVASSNHARADPREILGHQSSTTSTISIQPSTLLLN